MLKLSSRGAGSVPRGGCRSPDGAFGHREGDTEGPTVDDVNPALPSGSETMRIMVYSLLWAMQGSYHQP